MAIKRTATAAPADQNIAAAIDRMESANNQNVKDLGLLTAALERLMVENRDLAEELAQSKADHERIVRDMQFEHKRRYNEVANKHNEIVGKFNKVAEITGNKTESTVKID